MYLYFFPYICRNKNQTHLNSNYSKENEDAEFSVSSDHEKTECTPYSECANVLLRARINKARRVALPASCR